MKKILSLILVALMVLPFGVLASAAEDNKVDLPEMPTVTSDKVYYLAHGSTASENTPAGANVVKTQGWDVVKFPTTAPDMYNALKSGGTYIACGKIYIGATCDVAATDSPVLFTGVDTKNNIDFISKNADGTLLIADAEGNNAGQLGMVMIIDEATVTFHGDVIFDNIVLLDRGGMEKYVPTTYAVGPTGKMVITNTVQFAQMKAFLPALQVQEGGYLFLDALGFSNITGTGTLVLGDNIKDQVTEAMLKYYRGIVCSSDGTILYNLREDAPETTPPETDNVEPADTNEPVDTETPNTTEKADVTTNAPADTDAPTTGNDDSGDEGGSNKGIIIGVIAAVVVIGAVVFIVIKKKKAE